MQTAPENTKRKSWIKTAVTAFLVVLSLGSFAFVVAFSRYPEIALKGLGLGQWMRALTSLLALVWATAVVWFFRSVVGRRSVVSLGLSLKLGWWLRLLGGAALGLIAFMVVGINEELYFRGYLYTLLKERHGWTAAVTGSTLLFSVIHGMEPGFVPLVFVNILLIGAVLVLLRERTGSLWLPISFHWMWDYAQYYLFAVTTPAVEAQGLLNFFQPAGAYGPEKTITATILFGLLFIVLGFERLRRGVQPGLPGFSG